MRTLVLCFAGLFGLAASQYPIQAENGLWRGEWGFEDYCTSGGGQNSTGERNVFVGSFEFKYETTDHIDNTAGNSVKLYCSDDSGHILDYVTSTEGNYGTWQGIRACAKGHYVTGFRLRVLEYQGTFGDDWGVDNIQVECDDGTVLDGLDGVPATAQESQEKRGEFQKDVIVVDGKEVEIVQVQVPLPGRRPSPAGEARMHGEWGSWARCPSGYAVMGLMTMVEQGHPFEDDAGLCNLTMYCMPK
ncbi:vitelline membrane outer layer protein 1 homolog [Penaeus japonicus]|uniref:vitelline membrane outer layer protein 1 homolog n=1 Tax=Penaeus japonicus TaxID=27405 RepID=UPI001C7162DA|nr:vitelline membrane outer layer protein 1 homolog [Penaeus japonicus]